jgi:hypothetical protein
MEAVRTSEISAFFNETTALYSRMLIFMFWSYCILLFAVQIIYFEYRLSIFFQFFSSVLLCVVLHVYNCILSSVSYLIYRRAYLCSCIMGQKCFIAPAFILFFLTVYSPIQRRVLKFICLTLFCHPVLITHLPTVSHHSTVIEANKLSLFVSYGLRK